MDLALLRQKVREMLSMVKPGRNCTLAMLIEGTSRLVPFDVSEQQAMDAIEWNQAKGFIDFRYDSEAEVDSYYLTERGRAKK